MEYAITKYRFGTFGNVDNRHGLGHFMGKFENPGTGGRANVDQVDTAPFPGRPTDEPLLESTNPTGLCMYADIRRVEVVADVAFGSKD